MKKRIGKISDIFKRFRIEGISLSPSSASISISYTNWDAEAAWQLYVELLTRVATQQLKEEDGDEQAALESIHKLFQITRDVLKKYGKNAKSFTRIAIIILNQKIRPFTAKWHILSIKNEFSSPEKCKEFRKELESLRVVLISYARLLADMAHVDDLTEL